MTVLTRVTGQSRHLVRQRYGKSLYGTLRLWQPMLESHGSGITVPDAVNPSAPGTCVLGAGLPQYPAYLSPSDRPGGGAHVQLGTPGSLTFQPQLRIPIDSTLGTLMAGSSRSLAFWVRQDTVASQNFAWELLWSLTSNLVQFSRVWGQWRVISGILYGSWVYDDEGPAWSEGNQATNYTWVQNRWRHLTITYDLPSLTTRLYVDGALQFTVVEAGPRTYPFEFGVLVFGGASGNMPPLSIADVAMWSDCLTAPQVLQWYEDSLRGHPGAFGLRHPTYGALLTSGGGGSLTYPGWLISQLGV